jgi:capsular exopolysaccharide synthesis family protein
MLRHRWRLVALVLATGLALAYAATLLSPRHYVASGGVLVPGGMMKAQYVAADPQAAAALVQRFIASHRDPLLVDPPIVVRVAPSLATNLALGAALALLLSLVLLRRRAPRPVRSENELIATFGVPMVAARPLAPLELSRQLAAHWFGRGRAVLAVVSAERGDGRTRVTAELARAFAAGGTPTLVIDADFRSPALHRAFGVRNRAGLADFLEGRATQLAHCAENLSVLVAGRTSEDPLELLSRGRMQDLLAAAARRYPVVLIDTPAAARGPDLQLFAAFAGGALMVVRRPTPACALERLRELLFSSRARVVGTVLSPS